MKIIVVLAISPRDGLDMKRAIEEYATDQEQEARVVICTQLRELEGMRAHEFVMTEEFASQRSIRMLDAARLAVRKTKPATP